MKIEKYAYLKGYRITDIGNIINPKGNIVKGWISKDTGYLAFAIRIKNKIANVAFHRLQAFQKYGNKLYKKGIEVRHFNGIKLDNTFTNILIGTSSENKMDIPESIRINRAIYAASFIKKYNKIDVIKYHNENGKSYKKTMQHFSISSKGTLHYILNK